MNTERIPRILTPLLLAAAILYSFKYQGDHKPVELQPGEQPPRPIGEVQAAYESALATDAPGFTWGSPTATVTVLEMADFGCMYCAKFARESYPALMREYVDAGLVRWKYVPFVLGMFPNGREAARTAYCAGEHGVDVFKRVHDGLYATQDTWKASSDARGWFVDYARQLGLETKTFSACYDSPATEERIDAANRLADNLGVRATPTFFVNGVMIEGALPAQDFRALLNEALRASGPR